MRYRPLTKKQQPVYAFIQRYMAHNHYAPYIHEVQTGCGIRSYKSALDRLVALERRGFIKRIPNKHRGIVLLEVPPEGVEPQMASSTASVDPAIPLPVSSVVS